MNSPQARCRQVHKRAYAELGFYPACELANNLRLEEEEYYFPPFF